MDLLRGHHWPGNVRELQNVVFGAFNTLRMEIGGTARGAQYDALDVAGTLTFDGTLALSAIGGFVPITLLGLQSLSTSHVRLAELRRAEAVEE